MYFEKHTVSEISRQKKANIVQFHWHEIPRIGKLRETGDGIEVTRAESRENRDLTVNWYRVSLWDDEKVLEVDSGNGCTTLQICLMPLNSTLKMVKMVTCILCIYFARTSQQNEVLKMKWLTPGWERL